MPRCREFRISDYLVVLVLVPLVSLAFFRKWQRKRAAKRAEIRKLLALAAEEAARAEEEAAQVYTSTFVTRYQCALCFSPSTTRCSRCKAVRYCSGKCQIAHWRQGHKYECQPPHIDDSDASLPRVSAQGRETNLNSISEPQNVEPNNANVQGLSTSAEASDQSKESISELSPSKRSEGSASKIDPVIANEKPDLNYAIPKVLEFSVKSSNKSATHKASLGDALIPNDLMHENCVPDVPVSNTEYRSGTTRSAKPSTEGFITDVPTQKPSVSSISSSTSANNVLSSMVPESDFPVSKNERNELSESGTSNFEHNRHNFTNCTQNLCVSMDEPDLPVARNNPPVSEESVHDNSTLKAAKHSLNTSAHVVNTSAHVVNPSRSFNSGASINAHMVESSRSLNQSPSSSKTVMDDLTGKHSMKNITNLGNLVISSSGQKDSTSLNSKSSFNSMSKTDVHMGDACSSCNQSSSKKAVDSQTRKSPIYNTLNSRESVTSFPGQKNSVPLVSSSKSSQQTGDDSSSSKTSVSLDSTSMVMNTKIATSKVENQRASELSGTSRRSVRSAFQNSSPLKERAPVCSVSRQKSGSHDIISSNAFHTVVSSLPTGNALKASVKKVAQQLKSSKTSKQSSTKMINDSSGKSNQTLFPYESFVKLFNWDKLELPLCGLFNCGNSCYANVVLQCLIFTRPVSAYLLQGSHSKNCQRSERNNWCFMCELQHLAFKMRDGRGPISPYRILSQIQNIGNHLGYGREEDAHEFLRFAIDAMQSVCLSEADGDRVVDPLLQDTTLIQQTFGGYLQSKIKCLKCQYISERYDRMMDLNVEIEGNIESLQDALARFTAPEILDGENKYKCDRCKSYVKARKQLTIHEAPNILTIALKRFQSGKFGKLNKRVVFPEILNMKPYMSGAGDRQPTYKLYAVVVHLDMMNASFSGHYVCYVKNLQGSWYKLNDCKVKQVELDRVLSQGAYMLLYSRSSPRPPAIMSSGIIPSSTPANAVRCEHAIKTPVMQNGLERISVLGTSPATSCTVNLEDYGFDYNGAPSVKGIRIKGSREYADWASSDSGSLFSCSDEASWSTESNRDSTSTDDYSETIFGDSGGLTCTSSGLPEDPSRLHSSFFCTKSSPSLQTEYYFQNNGSFHDSVLSNQHLFDDIYHQNREVDPEMSISPVKIPEDTDGLPAWLNNSASSFFFSPSVTMGHVENSSDSDPSSISSYWLDSRSNKNKHAGFLQFQNSIGAPGVSESGAFRSEDFADPVKSKHIKEKHMPGFLQESARLNFDVPSRSFNATTNFDYCLVHDTRTSDSLTD